MLMSAAAHGQSSSGASTTAGHDIVMRATVQPSCRITNTAPQIRLTGTTDAGQAVDATVSGSGGFILDCNTPYAINLARTGIYAVQPPTRTTVAASTRGTNSAVAKAAAPVMLEESRDIDVVMRVAGREGPIEARCIMAAAAETPYVCDAIAGPLDARLPMPRTAASMIVTGALTAAASSASASDHAPGAAPAVHAAAPSAAEFQSQPVVVGLARSRATRVRIGERLTVSLSARY